MSANGYTPPEVIISNILRKHNHNTTGEGDRQNRNALLARAIIEGLKQDGWLR